MTAAQRVSIVTQTCVRPECAEAFARWQAETSTAISAFPGFIEQRLTPPQPPLQVDWVILQRFEVLADAQRWLASPERQKRLEGASAMLLGRDDVHIVQESERGTPKSQVATVISTRVKPGKEAEYRAWERRIAVAQSRAPGLQGYRFEPPIPGVQDDYLAILRFDTDQHMQAWLDSPERKRLVDEAMPLTEDLHARTVRTGFDHWFADDAVGGAPPAAWKMNMIVLLTLYPVVFLFGTFVGTPLLLKKLGLPFAIALFLGNVVSVSLTAFLVPWAAGYLGWWLQPASLRTRSWANAGGAALHLALYAAMVLVFWKFL